jgi:hypothetical protein
MNDTKEINRPNRPRRHRRQPTPTRPERLLVAQDEAGQGGQHSPPIGTSTTHSKCLYDFSIELRNRAALEDFERERKALAGKPEGQRF